MTSTRKINLFTVILLIVLTFGNVVPVTSKSDQKAEKPSRVPDVILVEVKDGVTLEDDIQGKAGHKFKTNSIVLDHDLASLGVQSVKPVFPPGLAKKAEAKGGDALSLSRVYRLKLKPNTDIEAVLSALSSNPDVLFAEPDYIATPSSAPVSHNYLVINDPMYPSDQWGMTKIGIENAWDDTYGAPTVAIAIIDSGIDLTHVDLAGNLWLNPGEVAGNGLDDDSNGFVDDVRGWNFVSSNNNVTDENGHGTLVAGVAAAVGGNGQGIVGVCPQCRIMPVKVMSVAGTANYSDVAAGVLYAAEKGAKVINISLGGYSNSNTLLNAINAATNTYGAVVVAGAGNDNSSAPFYPAAYNNVLAVAGTASDDTKVGTSNYGAWVDVSAPGENIRTTASGGGWADNSGTSFSAPFAAGVAGLLRAEHPTWNQATIRSQIVHTTNNIDSLNPSYSGLLGSGRLNAGAAMQAPHPILTMTEYAVNGQINGRPLLGATAQLTITLHNDWWDATGVTATLSTTDTGNVTVINGSASYGNIPATTTATNSTPFTISVAAGAGNNHPIPFKLHVTDTTGYSTDIYFTITTESGMVDTSGTISANTTWTNDKTYLIKANVGVAPGVTLTIQPGTTVKFNGNFNLNVGGTLVADGTSSQPIVFKHNTTGTWDKILFSDTSADAVTDGSGQYISGSILRYVDIQGANAGISCTTSTPYLSHVSTNSGGAICSLGSTNLWLMDNAIAGNVTITGSATAYRNTVSGNLSISGAGNAEDNKVNGTLSLGSGNAKRNDVTGLSISGSGGILENNMVSGGNVSLGASFSVTGNTIIGKLTTGTGATVDHNTVSNGIAVGGSSTVTWNNVENASGTGLAAGSNVTAQYNRLIGNVTGMTASTGLIEHNLIANNTGVGLQVSGNATISNNTFTGNQGNTIAISSGAPVIHGNNLDLNMGTYDLQNNSASEIDASGNWWGTTDTMLIDTRIFDYYDEFAKGKAPYLPILAVPDQIAPAYVRNVAVLPDTTLGIQTGTFEVQFSSSIDINYSPSMSFYSNDFGTWSQYNKSNSGLPDNDVYAIVIEADGTKWFGTDAGVASFNGTNWTVYNSSNSGLPSGAVKAIALEGNGTIWFGLAYNGVAAFDGVNWIVYDTTNSGLPSGSISAIAIDGNGIKWFGTPDDGVASFDGDNWHVYNQSNSGLPSNAIRAIAIENNSTKWFGTYNVYGLNDGGIASFDGTNWKEYNQTGAVRAIAIETDGTKWFGTYNRTIYSFDGTRWIEYIIPQNSYAEAIAIEANGTKWISTTSQGVASFDGIHWKIYNVINSGLSNINMYSIAIEPNGSKWFGTLGGVSVLHGAEQFPIVDNPRWASPSRFSVSYDITSTIPKAIYRVSLSNATDSDGMKVAPFSNTTFTVDFAGSITDQTPPTKPNVNATGSGGLTMLSAQWSSSDPESLITKYRYAIGTTPGGRDVVDWKYLDATSMTQNGLHLTAGVKYYVSVGARNEGGLWSESGVSNSITAGVLPPGAFGKSSPSNSALNQALNTTLKWVASANAVSYEYCLDAETVNNGVCDSGWKPAGSGTSKALNGLAPSTKYYWQMRAISAGGITQSTGLFWSFKTKANPLTSRSVGAGDGWILESAETGNKGGTINASATTFRLGDDAAKKQYRSILSFDTGASLPDNAVITKVTLKVKRQGIVGGGNPVTAFQGFIVDMRKGTFGTSALQVADWQANANKTYGPFTPALTGGWYIFDLTSAKAYINKLATGSGLTQIRLRFKLDDNDNAIANYLSLYSGNAGAASRPQLIIEYYVP